MQFNVPQFIEIEDKIFGPLTLKQFIYVIGGVGASFLFYRLFPLFVAILLILPTAGLAFMLAFKPIHGRPFSVVMEAAFKYLFSGKLYLWGKHKDESSRTMETEVAEKIVSKEPGLPKVKTGGLETLSWNLDVKKKG
jgi:hypothetical protein